jgi:ABC-type branched-chain amino acid transport systems, periplasmic component
MADSPRPDGIDQGPPEPVDAALSQAPIRLADSAWNREITRRNILKVLGLGAVGIGATAFLEACAPGATSSPRASSAAASSAASAAASAISSLPPSAGKIKIGFVTPQTGQVAGFASGDQFIVDRVRLADAYANGFTVGGKRYDVEIVVKDTQSDPARAAQVANDLILQDKVDMVVTTSTPETTNPVATACETNGVPCLSTVVPWEAWFIGRQTDPTNPKSWKPFKYTTMFFFGLNEFAGCFVPMWNRIPNNKNVAQMYPSDDDGGAFRNNFTPLVVKAGYKPIDGGAYPDGTTDFSSMISKFKTAQCDIYSNVPLPPDFNTFWKQAAQQGYKPKLATVAKVLLFPADTEALGDLVSNIATDCWWGPFMPYKSSLSGESGKSLADAYEAASGKQWLQTLGSTYSLFEVAQAAFGAVTDPHDKEAVAAALGKVSYTGICGPLDFTKGPFPGIGIIQPVGVQWRKGTTYPWEMVVVDNSLNKDVPVGGDLLPTNA